jgi:hypothetical protein
MAAMMIGVKSSKDGRSFIQDGLWFFKFVFIVGVGIAAFFIPNEFFIGYGYIALGGAAIFIVIQLILLVDFAHTWNEKWVAAYDESQSRLWAALLLGSTVTMYLASLIATILMYVYLQGASCGLNTTFISINLILCAVFSLFSINPRVCINTCTFLILYRRRGELIFFLRPFLVAGEESSCWIAHICCCDLILYLFGLQRYQLRAR